MKSDEFFLAKTGVLYKIKPEVSGLKYPASIIRPPASVRYKKVLKKFLSKRRKIFVKTNPRIRVRLRYESTNFSEKILQFDQQLMNIIERGVKLKLMITIATNNLTKNQTRLKTTTPEVTP